MSSPRKKVKKEEKEELKENDKENPTDVGPGITESWRLLRRGGTLVAYGSASTKDDEGNANAVMLKLIGRLALWNALPNGRSGWRISIPAMMSYWRELARPVTVPRDGDEAHHPPNPTHRPRRAAPPLRSKWDRRTGETAPVPPAHVRPTCGRW